MMSESIARTGFYVSLFSYIVFWLMDFLRPGFVSRSFSVHLFLLAAMSFGLWWAVVVKIYVDRQWAFLLLSVVLGVVFASVTWALGAGFGALRFVVVIIAFFVPILFFRLINES